MFAPYSFSEHDGDRPVVDVVGEIDDMHLYRPLVLSESGVGADIEDSGVRAHLSGIDAVGWYEFKVVVETEVGGGEPDVPAYSLAVDHSS